MTESEQIYQVVTANRLRDGTIVYMTKDGSRTGWSDHISYAYVADESEIADLVAQAESDMTNNVVVGAYAIEIAGNKEPITARERIRATGPSTRYGDDAVPFNSSDFEI